VVWRGFEVDFEPEKLKSDQLTVFFKVFKIPNSPMKAKAIWARVGWLELRVFRSADGSRLWLV
jgi:hypothetical protein